MSLEHGAALLDPLFFADVCVTTFDQFLYGYARAKRQVGRHLDLPAGAIAHSIVVFDEAHLYSPYTHSLMRAIIEILCASRIPTVVMTATMPRSLERALFEAVEAPVLIEFDPAEDHGLPERRIRWSREEWSLLDGQQPSAELKEILHQNRGRKVLIVANRVDVAQDLAEGLAADCGLLIHSRFTVSDRKTKEAILVGDEREPGLLGRGQDSSAVVVSTQVCEVGLDISCDVLVTECASADALVQRAGRLARWGGEGRMFVVRPLGRDGPVEDWGRAFPYVDHTCEEESRFEGLELGHYAGIAWECLGDAPERLFTDWDAAAQFCDEMQYQTNDVEAKGALGQLFDATLYADERPHSLSARGDLYCTVAVVPKDWLASKSEIPYPDLRDRLINVSYLWLKRHIVAPRRGHSIYDPKTQRFEAYALAPFSIVGLDQDEDIDGRPRYSQDLGLHVPRGPAEDTEEASACLII